MKRVFVVVWIGIIVFQIFTCETTSAQTLGSLKTQLQQQEQALQETEQQKKMTEEEMNEVNASIVRTKKEIESIQADMKTIEQEIVKMNEQIKLKEVEMKDIIHFVQVSNGESAYMEYAFGAQSFTDFIYRIAVAEQLASYNERLIKEYNEMIQQNEKKKKELEQKQQQLGVKQDNLARQMSKLELDLGKIEDVHMDIKDQIKFQKELIQLYEAKGCKDNEDIKVCGRETLPRDTRFWRPLMRGRVTSEYGVRDHISGIVNSEDHTAIDLSAGPSTTTPVYAAANGMVAGILIRQKCGGNQVILHHNINGRSYTTMYAHLLTINVSKGDIVTKDTVIGIQGGGPETTSWDTCTRGYHVHFMMANGLYGTDYHYWNTFISKTFNPREMINVPLSHSVWWNDRITKY